MFPVLFKIGSFEVRSFGLLLVLAFAAALYMATRRAPRHGIEPKRIADVAFWMLFGGVIGARLLFILQEIPYYRDHPEQLATLRFDGLTSFGGILGGLAVLVVWARRTGVRMLAALDVFGVPFLIGHAIGRVGCLMNGCCHGVRSDLPWAIHVQGSIGAYHPAQVYDALMTVGAALAIVLLERRMRVVGQSAMAAVLAYGLTRFVYEFWRAGTFEEVQSGLASSTYWGNLPVTEAQVAALAMVLVGLVGLVRLSKAPTKVQSASDPR